MRKRSKLLTAEIVKKARSGLRSSGKQGSVAMRLKAIIAAQQQGLTAVARYLGSRRHPSFRG